MDISSIRNTGNMLNKKIKGNQDVNYYLLSNSQIHPFQESFKIAIICGLLGIVWIAFPDEWISHLTNHAANLRVISIYKGWAYVIFTVLLIFSIVLKKLLLFQGAIHKLEHNLRKQKAIEHELHKLAYYDTLTGMPNRSWFENKCNNLMNSPDQNKFAFIYMDVDNFKNINDTLGHLAGDQFLKHVSKNLLDSISSNGFAARMGGDEFAIILDKISTETDIMKQIQNLLYYFRRPWRYENQDFYVSVSMGIVMYPDQADTLSLLLRNSDIAMYAVKKNSKDSFCFYHDELRIQNLKQITLNNELHKAIRNEEFVLLYQPIMDLETNQLNGVEALIRWNHPERGFISPMEFIPIAEESGLIHDIGRWVLRTAFLQKKEWEDLGYPHLKMSINVSGKSLIQEGFVSEIQNLLAKTNLTPEEIQLEITESVLIERMDISRKVLKEISDMGIKIALDDFGTGYSSLTYLKNLPIDVVKLDANFVKGIMENGEDSVIVQSVIKLTHDLELEMVAEGVETDDQLSLLKSNQCDYGQGYLFSRPVTWSMIEEMMLTT